MTTLLPDEFADLEPFAATWCLATEPERWERRMASSMDELLAFYDAAFPRLAAAIERCDRHPLDDLPADAERLLQLVHSLVLVAMAVDRLWHRRPGRPPRRQRQGDPRPRPPRHDPRSGDPGRHSDQRRAHRAR